MSETCEVGEPQIRGENKETTLQDQTNSPKEKRSFQNATSNFNKPCWFFDNYGTCRYGNKCRYIHRSYRNYKPRNKTRKPENRNTSQNSQTVPRNGEGEASKDENRPEIPKQHVSETGYKRKPYFSPKCRVFTNSSRYKSTPKPTEQDDEKRVASEHAEAPKRTLNTRFPMELQKLTEEDIKNTRETEILLLKKRYPKLTEAENKFAFLFSPSDPEWTFDIKMLSMEVALSSNYPSEICDIHISDEEHHMPPMFLKFLNQQVKKWLEERFESLFTTGKIELVLRPFFRWFDRNLEDLFLTGLRKVKLDLNARNAGLEFVPFEDLPGAKISSSLNPVRTEVSNETEVGLETLPYEDVSDATVSSSSNDKTHDPKEKGHSESEDGNQSGSKIIEAPVLTIPKKKGTEIKLLNLDLTENVASLQCQNIALMIRCMRCKTFADVTSLTKQKRYCKPCSKCHQEQTIDFNPVLVHAFSSSMGYLNLTGCQAVDMFIVQCQFLVTCFSCNKQNFTDGIHYGQTFNSWCLFCNKKLCLSVQASKFVLLQPIETTRTSKIFLDGTKKKVRDSVIEEGKPLPNHGICKHYKKSHRWLRFPCCGKAYPCDLCHDEKETGHEMKFASRMICGHCCKEQPYTKDRPCISCSSTMAKKTGTHWEGGKGCRNKTKMSRDDQHKYSGVAKTVSRKAASQETKN